MTQMASYPLSKKMKMSTERTGKNVKIAVIDSGINPYHSHVNGVEGGIQLRVNRNMCIEEHHDYRDRLGHGTAVAAAIRGIASEAQLYAIKIFDDKLASYPSVLAEAIEWAVSQEFDIINLSLGLPEDHECIRNACELAYNNGVAIVSAIDEDQKLLWPAKYPHVFGVRAGEVQRNEWMFYTETFFYACGFPRELHGPEQLYNMHGHSFAAAHFSANLALMLEDNPSWSLNDLWNYFIELKQEIGGGSN